MIRNSLFLPFLLFLLFSSLSPFQLSAQVEESGTLNHNDTLYNYHWMGDLVAADPREQIPSGYESFGQRGWISYAITHQLSKAKREVPEFYEHAERITNKRNLQGTMSAITQGCGYYLYCNNGTKDLKYEGTGIVYRIFINTDLDEIYMGEMLGDSLIEVHKCYVGRKWFEENHESYERPVVTGNPVCREPAPEPQPPLPVVEPEPEPISEKPIAIIEALSDSGQAPLTVRFDGRRSYDPDGGKIVKYSWDFGGSSTSNDSMPSFTYENEGVYQVLLRVLDDEGEFGVTTFGITVTPNVRFTYPPVAKILANQFGGAAPFSLRLDGTDSFDPDGGPIVQYQWDYGKGEGSTDSIPSELVFNEAGKYRVSLIVIDDEGEADTTSQLINVYFPPPPPPPIDSCWMMSYTLSTCGDRVDTLVQTPIRVPCPAPPAPQIIWTDRDCDAAVPERFVEFAEKNRRIRLAGGPIFMRYRGQLPEYALGVNAQIRFAIDRRNRFSVLADVTALPVRKATPLDDRPYKWSELRDSIDVETGLPLVWYRGTRRGTAGLGVGFELAPWEWLYGQGMFSVERTFHQEEISDPRKNP